MDGLRDGRDAGGNGGADDRGGWSEEVEEGVEVVPVDAAAQLDGTRGSSRYNIDLSLLTPLPVLTPQMMMLKVRT